MNCVEYFLYDVGGISGLKICLMILFIYEWVVDCCELLLVDCVFMLNLF